MIRFAIPLSLFLLSSAAFPADLPDPKLTPGVVRTTDLNVICHQTTKQFRNTTESMKIQVYRAYGMDAPHKGYCAATPEGCEIDHLISLELGGADSVANLWPQAYPIARQKDHLENELHKRVCSGQLTPIQAQQMISKNWIEAYQQIFGASPK